MLVAFLRRFMIALLAIVIDLPSMSCVKLVLDSAARYRLEDSTQVIPESYLLAWYAAHVTLSVTGKHMAKNRMNYMRYAKAMGSPLFEIDWERLPVDAKPSSEDQEYWATEVIIAPGVLNKRVTRAQLVLDVAQDGSETFGAFFALADTLQILDPESYDELPCNELQLEYQKVTEAIFRIWMWVHLDPESQSSSGKSELEEKIYAFAHGRSVEALFTFEAASQMSEQNRTETTKRLQELTKEASGTDSILSPLLTKTGDVLRGGYQLYFLVTILLSLVHPMHALSAVASHAHLWATKALSHSASVAHDIYNAYDALENSLGGLQLIEDALKPKLQAWMAQISGATVGAEQLPSEEEQHVMLRSLDGQLLKQKRYAVYSPISMALLTDLTSSDFHGAFQRFLIHEPRPLPPPIKLSCDPSSSDPWRRCLPGDLIDKSISDCGTKVPLLTCESSVCNTHVKGIVSLPRVPDKIQDHISFTTCEPLKIKELRFKCGAPHTGSRCSCDSLWNGLLEGISIGVGGTVPIGYYDPKLDSVGVGAVPIVPQCRCQYLGPGIERFENWTAGGAVGYPYKPQMPCGEHGNGTKWNIWADERW